jgi:hypothetical protein
LARQPLELSYSAAKRLPDMCPLFPEQQLASPGVLCAYVRTIWGRHSEIYSKYRDRGTRDIPHTDRCRAWSTCSWFLYPDDSHISPFSFLSVNI